MPFREPRGKALRAKLSPPPTVAGDRWAREGGVPCDSDPCEHYRPLYTTRRGDDDFVEMLGSGGCQSHTTSDVIVKVVWGAHRPVFVNFLLSTKSGDVLKSLLRRLKRQRQRERVAP